MCTHPQVWNQTFSFTNVTGEDVLRLKVSAGRSSEVTWGFRIARTNPVLLTIPVQVSLSAQRRAGPLATSEQPWRQLSRISAVVQERRDWHSCEPATVLVDLGSVPLLFLQFFDENMILRDVAIGTCKVPLSQVRLWSQVVCLHARALPRAVPVQAIIAFLRLCL